MDQDLIRDMYINKGLNREEISILLNISIHKLKRLLKKYGILRRRLLLCTECGIDKIFSNARCRKCYQRLPKVLAKTKEYKSRPEVKKKAKLVNTKRNKSLKGKIAKQKHRTTDRYKETTRKYNEQYRIKYGYLKRPAIYWQNRYSLIQEDPRCINCKSNFNLEAHHIIPVAVGNKAGWLEERIHSKTNLLILCKKCHRSTETYSIWH